jgi:hypothetical protein
MTEFQPTGRQLESLVIPENDPRAIRFCSRWLHTLNKGIVFSEEMANSMQSYVPAMSKILELEPDEIRTLNRLHNQSTGQKSSEAEGTLVTRRQADESVIDYQRRILGQANRLMDMHHPQEDTRRLNHGNILEIPKDLDTPDKIKKFLEEKTRGKSKLEKAQIERSYKMLLPVDILDELETGKKLHTSIIDLARRHENFEQQRVVARTFKVSQLKEQGLIKPEEFERWQKMTRLSDFRMRIFLPDRLLKDSNNNVLDAIRSAGSVYKVYMGWLSNLETAEMLPAELCRQTTDGSVVITFDAPGQFESPLVNPDELDSDPHLATVQQYLYATDMSLKLFGLDDNSDLLKDKFQVDIGHSRGAVAVAHKGRKVWENPNHYGIILEPVSHYDHKRKTAPINWMLGKGSEIANIPLLRGPAEKMIVPALVEWYIGSADEDTKRIHRHVFEKTSPKFSGRSIQKLMQTRMPSLDFLKRDFLSSHCAMYVAEGDQFVHPESVLEETSEAFRKKLPAVFSIQGGHYAHLRAVNRKNFEHALSRSLTR